MFKRRTDCPGLSIAHVVLSLDNGGLERVVLSLVAQQAAQGHRTQVLCLERPGVLADAAISVGAEVKVFDKRAGISPELVRSLARYFKSSRPDVIHTHQLGALFHAGPAAWKAGVPCVVHTEHGRAAIERRRSRYLARWASLFADRFVCVSREIADTVVRTGMVSHRKVSVVRNGIEIEPFEVAADTRDVRAELRIPPDALVVGSVGRLSEVKRHSLLVRSFATVRQHCPRACLLLVGDGPERSDLQHQCDELGIAEYVRFAGFQPRPASFYRAMDVFALTSRSEGLPLAVLEASACRLPVLASDVGGLSEIVEHQTTGLLFPPESEEVLTGSLVRLLDDAELRRNLGAAASHRVRQSFSADRMGEHYRRHYLACLWAAGRSVANGDKEFDDDAHGLTHCERVSSY